MALQPIYLIRFFYFFFMLGISFSIGIKIALKYFEHNNKVFLLVGITAIIVSEPWWTTPIDAMLLFLGHPILPDVVSQFIGAVGLPIGIFTWLYAITELMYKQNQKKLLIISALYCGFFEVLFIPIALTYHRIVEHLVPMIIIGSYLVSFLLVVLITGLLFAQESIKSDEPTLRLKGRFLRFAFIFYFLAGMGFIVRIFDVLITLFLIISAFGFYFGFALPERIKKMFL